MSTAPQMNIFEAPEPELTWKSVLNAEREKPYFKEILAYVEAQRAAGKTIYPKNSEVFNALHFTPLANVKVVILGQDPYHGPGQAHGLCFSVKPGVSFPPSLDNIFKELETDLGIARPKDGCLEKWAKQGVLLLNAVLTVEAHKPQSHAQIGWQTFTDQVVRVLNENKSGLVFMLWGSHAQQKGAVINPTKHTILKSTHPSPLSAYRGFMGCRHFSQANEVLKRQGLQPIDWSL